MRLFNTVTKSPKPSFLSLEMNRATLSSTATCTKSSSAFTVISPITTIFCSSGVYSIIISSILIHIWSEGVDSNHRQGISYASLVAVRNLVKFLSLRIPASPLGYLPFVQLLYHTENSCQQLIQVYQSTDTSCCVFQCT